MRKRSRKEESKKVEEEGNRKVTMPSLCIGEKLGRMLESGIRVN